jgi:hypothetical protein
LVYGGNSMRHCESCQAALPDNARYCSRCGHEVDSGRYRSGYRKAALEDLPDEQFSEAAATWQGGLQSEVNWAIVEPTLVLPPVLEPPVPESLLDPSTFPPLRSLPDDFISNPVTPIPPSLVGSGAELTDIFNTPTQSIPVVQLEIPSAPLPVVPSGPVERKIRSVAPAPVQTTQHRPWTKWLIASIAFLLIVSGVAGAFLLSFSPMLSFEGSSSVTPGSILRIHGSGFFPDSRVSLLLDSRVPLTTGTALERGGGEKDQQLDMASLAQLFASHQLSYQSSGNTVPASLSGQFDIAVMVDPRWSPGQHTILAVDNVGSRTTAVSFTILPGPAQLSFLPSILDFGKLEQGMKAILTLSLFNTGGSQMYWSATVGNAAWLHLSQKAGVIRPNNGEQLIYITADTTHLPLGAQRATLQLYSDGGQISLPVHVQVVPLGTKSPLLQVAPATLSFGQVEQGTQTTLVVAVSNTGAQTLHWKVGAAKTPWLTLAPVSGSIQPGGLPQTIQVTVATANLTLGNYTASLSIQSDGGDSFVTCLLAVVSPNPNVIILSPTSTLPPQSKPTFSPSPQPTVTSQPTPRVTPSPQPSPTPVNTPTPTPVTPTPPVTPTATPTPSPTDTPTPTPTDTPTPTPTNPPTPTPTPTDTPTPTPTNPPTPTPNPTPTPTPTPIATLTPTPTPTSTDTPTPTSTDTPTPVPSLTASPSPTEASNTRSPASTESPTP